MSIPDESAFVLNGRLIGRLLDLKAIEAIDDIRQFFARDCQDVTCAGDLEEVEIEPGFHQERSTPKPGYTKLYGVDLPDIPEKPDSDEPWSYWTITCSDTDMMMPFWTSRN